MKKQIDPEYSLRPLTKRLLAFILANLVICFSMIAQELTISGKVTDATTGEALIGVSVALKGTTVGTITDIDGNYSINANADGILVFSYLGYVNQEITVGSQTQINVAMSPELIDLDEVVVIGYGVQKKKLVTGATVQVKNEYLVRNHVTRLESSLQGLTPGMLIVKRSGQPGSDFNITIRGLASPNGSDPLVLIDGVPGSLNNLNPSDVETVDILKDAASAAIYGSRGADGVILITTRKGKSGEPQITYDGYYGISNTTRTVPMLNAKEYATILNEGYYNVSPTGRRAPFTQEYIDTLGEGTDWQEEALNKNAPRQSHYLGITGGNEKSSYSMSFSYDKEEGIYNFENKSNYERTGIRINSEHKLKKYLTLGENLTYTHRYSRGMGTGNQYNNFMRGLLSASPLIEPYDPSQYDGFGRSTFNLEQINPIASMHYNYNGHNKNDDIVGDIYAELEIIKGLKIRSDFGGTLSYYYNSDHTDTFHVSPYTSRYPYAIYSEEMNRNFTYNIDNIITYEKAFGGHNVLVMAGMNAQENFFYELSGNREGFISNIAPVISNVTTIDTTRSLNDPGAWGDYGTRDQRFSIFGRLSYNYEETILATFTMRRDGSSRFGSNNRFGYFPSVSAGWVISNAGFLRSATWLDFLKMRASWGKNGKEPTERWVYLATVGTEERGYTFGSGAQVGVSPDKMPNPYLKWESSVQTNIGFDARLLRNIRMAFDWYKKTSKDWIINPEVPGITGLDGISDDNPPLNAGDVVNQGVELEVGYTKNFGDLMIDVSANMSYNKNEVINVPGEFILGDASVLYNGSEEFYRIEEDYPLGYFRGYVTDGIFQTQEEVDNYINEDSIPYQRSARPGDVKRIDLNGDGVIDDDDKTMLGDPNPDYIYGFNLAVAYKGFDFSVNIQAETGHQIVKCYRAEERTYFNYTTDILDRWHWIDLNEDGIVDPGEGTSNTVPRVTNGNEANQNWRKFSDLYIHDADFLKIKSINLGYDFKQSLLKNTPVQQFRIYVAATNLLTLTKYNGMDPEVGYQGGSDYASGIDMGFYPAAKTYLVGVNVKF